ARCVDQHLSRAPGLSPFLAVGAPSIRRTPEKTRRRPIDETHTYARASRLRRCAPPTRINYAWPLHAWLPTVISADKRNTHASIGIEPSIMYVHGPSQPSFRPRLMAHPGSGPCASYCAASQPF